ncbi:hypothetical protein [Streptomyces sp. NPDC001508]|uniref:VG15 protein n=1 Tax=Streptomyces sp. NPDC001508 TaxID=3154656 RepID=UPI00333465E0
MVDEALRAVALAQYRRQQALVRRAANRVQAVWRQINRSDITGSWEQLSPLLVAAVVEAQTEAARLADPYLDEVLAAEHADPAAVGRVNPSAFAGIASDGRPLLSLLYQPVIDWKVRMLAGQSMQDAFHGAMTSALRITATQVADAGRGATGVAMAGRRTIQGYVRVVNPPACSRCIILAGKEFGWNKGFQRHPRCKCIHLPTTLIARNQHRRGSLGEGGGFLDPDAYFSRLSAAEQDRIFGRAGARAIREGADIAQVVNARRGMYTADAYGRRVAATREGATRRGAFWRQERRRAIDRGLVDSRGRDFRLRTPRLMPEEIFRLAESRDEALAMLRRFGYLT